jgi:hypothetical protein
MTATYTEKRCRSAIQLGDLATHCILTEGHEGRHAAKGLANPDHTIEWDTGHRWAFETDPDDNTPNQ